VAVLFLTVVVFGLALLGLAAGILLSGRCLRGSCGGGGPDGDRLSCVACPNRRRGDAPDP
jgi:hypothetical protein